MAFGDNLSVRISAQTRDFESGINDARDELSKFRTGAVATSASLQGLQGRADEAEDEISSVGRSAATASLSLGSLSTAAQGAGLSLSGLGTTLVVGLLPTLALLSTALVPITAALGGLAAIIGSIGLVGFAGVLGAVKTNTQLLKQEALSLVADLKQEFAPFFDAFAGALVTLIDRLQSVVSELAPTQAEAERLADSLVEFGTAVIDVLPALTDLVLSLTKEFLPPLIELAEDVLPEVPGFIEGLVSTFKELAPELSGAGRSLIRLTRALFDLGLTVINVVGPRLGTLTRITTDLITQFNSLDGDTRNLGVALGLIAGPALTLATILTGPVGLAVAGVTAAVVALGKAWKTNFAGIRDVVGQLQSQVKRVLPQIKSAFNAFVSGVGFDSINKSLNDFEQTLGTQLLKNAKALKPVFTDLKGLLKDNKEEFNVLGQAVGRVVEGIIDLSAFAIDKFGPAFRTVVIPTLKTAIDVMDVLLTRLSNGVKLLGALEDGDLSRAAGLLEDITIGEGNNIGQTPAPTPPSARPNVSTEQRNSTQVNVNLQGGDEITDIMKREAEVTVENKERQALRTTGGTSRP